MIRGLRAIRQERGLSLRDLSRKTGIGVSTIGNFETGRSELSHKLLGVLAAALESTEADITSATGSAHPPLSGSSRLIEIAFGAPANATLEQLLLAAYETGRSRGFQQAVAERAASSTAKSGRARLTFSGKLARLIADKNLTQEQLGDALGIVHTTVGRWLSGKSKPYPRIAQRLADYFSVPVETLLNDALDLPTVATGRSQEVVA